MFENPGWFKSMGAKGVPFLVGGEIIVWTVNVLIIVSTFAFCFETLEMFSSDPHKNYNEDAAAMDYKEWKLVWTIIEIVCVMAFTIDFGVRMVCGVMIGRWAEFRSDFMNVIDIVAIAPFYIQLFIRISGSEYVFVDLRFLRVIRLARILRSLPEQYAGLGSVVYDIIVGSAQALFLPIFFMSLAMMVCAAITVIFERTDHQICRLVLEGEESVYTIDPWDGSSLAGNYDTGKYIGMLKIESLPDRVVAGGLASLGISPCDITDIDANGDGTVDAADAAAIQATKVRTGDYQGCPCPGNVYYVAIDGIDSSSSNFDSMSDSMWWVITTFTTVGYGDFNPQRPWGQMMGTFTMFAGIFFLAMPLAIVGNAFASAWAKAQAKEEERLAAIQIELDLKNGIKSEVIMLKKERGSMLTTMDQITINAMTHESLGQVDLAAQFCRITDVVSKIVDRCSDSHLDEVKKQITAFVEKIDEIQDTVDKIQTHETAADRQEAAEKENELRRKLAEEEEAANVLLRED